MKKWKEVRDERLSSDQKQRVDERVREELVSMSLQQLRKARHLTQTELASHLDISQPELSRLENSHNPLLSTIRRYASALGGKLKVIVEFDDGEEVELEGM